MYVRPNRSALRRSILGHRTLANAAAVCGWLMGRARASKTDDARDGNGDQDDAVVLPT